MTSHGLFERITRHLLEDKRPSEYLNEIYETEAFAQHPFDMLKKLKQTEQSPKYHPEGNVWKHTMLVVDECAKQRNNSKDKAVIMWASLLHDIGKPQTTRVINGRITSYDHDIAGAELSNQFLECLTQDKQFINKVSMLIRYHMHILYVVKNLPYGDKKSMKIDTDIDELAILGLADRLGRGKCNFEKEKKNIAVFIEKSKKI
ncbi:MAG: HDIG domain-containing protein [Oscillospiraceae bacterium]